MQKGRKLKMKGASRMKMRGKKACESRVSEAGVVGHITLPTLTRLTDTLDISHWTINRPVSCARANAKEIELVT